MEGHASAYSDPSCTCMLLGPRLVETKIFNDICLSTHRDKQPSLFEILDLAWIKHSLTSRRLLGCAQESSPQPMANEKHIHKFGIVEGDVLQSWPTSEI